MKTKKLCSFYVNEYHLIVMLLPYIDEKIKKNENIVVLSQINLQKNVKTILERLTISKEEKSKILKLNWKKTETENIESFLEKTNKKQINNLVIIGDKNYLEDVKNILKKDKNKTIDTIIDCYEVMEFNKEMNEILSKHSKILNTSGEKEIEEVFDGFYEGIRLKYLT